MHKGEQMTIQTSDIYNNIGEIISIKENDFLEDGNYQIIDEDEVGTTLYDIKNETIREVKFDDEEFDKILMGAEDRMRLLYDAYTKIVLNLMREGYSLPEEHQHVELDITPWLNKLRVLKIMVGAEYE